MKYLRLILPFIIFVILLYLYFAFRTNINNVVKNNSFKNTVNIVKTIPKVNFLNDKVGNISQNFSLNLPSLQSNYYSFHFNKTAYQIASNLGINNPPSSTSNNQIMWSVGSQSLIYSNSSYFYSMKNDTQKVNIYSYSNSTLSNDFGISGINFEKNLVFSQGEQILYYYPRINNSYIYKTNGVKFYDEFIFTDSNNPVSFSVYPFNITQKLGKSYSFTLKGSTLSKTYSYISTNLQIQSISFLSERQGYFIDLINSKIIPVYILSAKADIINNTILPMFIYVPEIKVAS